MSPPSVLSSSPSFPISFSPPPTTTTSAAAVTILSKCTVRPDQKSAMDDLRLSVSDLPMLSCHYIQKGLFLPPPGIPIHPLLSLLLHSLSRALSLFPPLAGRLTTSPHDDSIHISCNDAGAQFLYATSSSLTLSSLLPASSDVPVPVKSLFPLDGAVSYRGHSLPLSAFQLTLLADGAVFLGAAVNHAVVDGTSFWNFFNAWAELCRRPEACVVSRMPDFRRNFFGESTAVLRFPDGAGPKVTFDASAPLRERILHFSRGAISHLKSRANRREGGPEMYKDLKAVEEEEGEGNGSAAISSFQSLCAHLWVSVTRARKHLPLEAETTFRMAVNCRHRVEPAVSALYLGNAIQSAPTTATVGELVREGGLRRAGLLLHRSVAAHGDGRVRGMVADWEASPRCFPLGNPSGAGVTMGSSPRFPMYEGSDFGWGEAVAVRSGRANKFDGKISAFPAGRGGKAGSVDLEVCLAPETMAALLYDGEFMRYVSEEEEEEDLHATA